MRMLRQVFVASLFVLVAITLGFCFYPAVAGTIRALNEGISEGPGYYNAYTRFVPAAFEEGVSAIFDLALSCVAAAGLIYGGIQWKHGRADKSLPTDVKS